MQFDKSDLFKIRDNQNFSIKNILANVQDTLKFHFTE